MKRLKLFGILISLILLVLAAASCSGDPDTTGAVTTEKPTVTTPALTTPAKTEDTTPEDKELRVLISSDIHCTTLQTWYGTSYRKRMQHWVDTVLKEHQEKPFDLVVINGDISLDYWINGGSVISRDLSTSKIFIDDYLSQLPEELPVFVIPGNHEQYSDEDWFEITGNHRKGYLEVGGTLFVFLDNFSGNLDPTVHHDGVYTRTDVAFIEEAMAAHPDSDVYLIAHHFNTDSEGVAFRKLLKENDRIKGLFAGHTHKTAIIELGAAWGNKTIAQTGNFAYFKDSAKESFWGFRELVITDTDAYSQYIIAESEAIVDGVKTKFERTLRAQVTYYGSAPTLPEEPDPLAGYVNLFDKIDQSSVDGDEGMKETNRVQLALDNKADTKWCVKPTAADGSVTMTWRMTEPVRIDCYAISTANDAADRNPDAWTLYAKESEDGEWIAISSVTNASLPKDRFTVSQIFEIEDAKAYQYYKLTVTESLNNRSMYQFGELILLEKP